MKTIWAIVGGLVAMMILSFVMIFVAMAHPPAPERGYRLAPLSEFHAIVIAVRGQARNRR